MVGTEDRFRDDHIVALIQALPEFMGQLSESADALALVSVVQDLLASPSEGESQYIGLTLQAPFGVHLLGYDPDTLAARAEAIKRTSRCAGNRSSFVERLH